ncbi:MAG: carbonic anhydrase family protein [Gammaproteobacteria bacterium]
MKRYWILILAVLIPWFAHADETKGTWGYGEKDGPAVWGKLDPKFALCGDGKEQSPINIDTSAAQPVQHTLTFHYSHAPAMTKVGSNFAGELVNPGEDYVVFDGDKYILQSFHFHTPSEHKVNNTQYPLEGHFIHQNSAGKLLVVGVFFQPGAQSNAFQPLLEGTDKTLSHWNPTSLIPATGGYYSYDGSLTTPPCGEGVNWVVMKQVMPIASDQWQMFKTHFGQNNARPTQPLNQRKVFQST